MASRDPLTLAEVPDTLLAGYGLRHGWANGGSYQYTDSNAVLLPLAEIDGPMHRLLNEKRLRSLLQGIRDRVALPPVVVFKREDVSTAQLIQGMHRWRLSQALGFTMIPCITLSPHEAAEYGLT